MKARDLAPIVLSILVMTGCTDSGTSPSKKPQSAEAFCASLPTVGYGHFFYCGTTQANLDKISFPDGAHGFCQTADESLGLVGYSAITYSGGAGPVMSQSRASELSRELGNQSPGYIRCTRE